MCFPKGFYEDKKVFVRNKDIARQKPLFSIERPTASCRLGLGIGADEKWIIPPLPVCSESGFLPKKPAKLQANRHVLPSIPSNIESEANLFRCHSKH